MARAIYGKPLLCPKCAEGFAPNPPGIEPRIFCSTCEDQGRGTIRLRPADCAHMERFRLYRRAPRSDGGGFLPHKWECADCGDVFSGDVGSTT